MMGDPRAPAVLPGLVMALGTQGFAASVLNLLRAATPADHLLSFMFERSGMVRCVLDEGALGDRGTDFAGRYTRGAFTMDPFYPEVSALRAGEHARCLHCRKGLSSVFRDDLIDRFGISDFAGLAINDGTSTHYALVLRVDGQDFSDEELARIALFGTPVTAALAKHAALATSSMEAKPAGISSFLSHYAQSASFAGRELDMCQGILNGSSSEDIANELNISINSVLTYRKRLYQRLGISSQHELFDRVLTAMMQDVSIAS